MKYIFAILLIVNPITFIAETNERQEKAGQFFRTENYRKAIEEYTFILEELETKSDEIYLNLAHSFFQMRNADRSAYNYSKLLNSRNLTFQSIAYNQLGFLASEADNDLKRGLEYYKKALIANPQNEEARFNYELIKKRILANINTIGGGVIKQDSTKNSPDGTDQMQDGREKKIKTEVLKAESKGKEILNQNLVQNTDNQEKLQPEKLEEIELNKEKAEAILNAIKNQEAKYIQQKPRKKSNNTSFVFNKPDW